MTTRLTPKLPTTEAKSVPAQPEACALSRRDFMKAVAAIGSGAFLGSLPKVNAILASTGEGFDYPLGDPAHQIYSVCQQCNTQCGIKVKVVDGVAVKIDGNPFSPWNLVPHLDYKTAISDTARIDAPLCPKGQAGLQSAYDPYRLVKVLKRAGKRGENKWVTIDFDQAVSEIVNGGKLFANVPGEENREVQGLKSLRALTDPKVMKAMSDAIKKIWAEKDAEKKQALVEQFKADFADHLDKMIDPEHPDLGPKNNQILYFWGRQKGGRSDIALRFFRSGLGTTNTHGHTTVCQGSLYFAGKSMSDQWDGSKFTGGAKAYWQGDTASADFVIFVGASPFEGNYGPTNRVPRITPRVADGAMKYVVIDPRLSKTAGKAWKWLPNKPGTEAAIALGMIQWIIANERFDVTYLADANKAAAQKAGEPTWSNAAWLVKITDGKPGKFLRGSDLKLVEKKGEKKDEKTVVTYVTNREIAMTKSRTPGNYWLRALMPENAVIMNAQDARARGLNDGDRVRITSATNPEGIWDLGNGVKMDTAGRLKVVQGMRPGVISFALGFGHWAYGSQDIAINGQTIKADPTRVMGFHANAAMRTDPLVTNTTLLDPIGGSAVFYDTQVKVTRV